MMNEPSIRWREIFTPGVILAALGLAVALLLGVSLLIAASKPARSPAGLVTAALTVIPIPSSTPLPPTPLPVTPTVTLDPNLPPAPPTGEISVGVFVQISGTGGDGLRLRSGPGLANEPQFLGFEGEIFQVEDGPVQADGYVWWRLQAPAGEQRQGWAVSNYLQFVQNP
jgi:hypothetical protein